MIARMIDKGFLARERSATDARAKTVRLTAKGRAALDEVGPKVAAADARILANLTSGKRDAFITALGVLAEAGEASLVGDEPSEPKKKKKADKADRAPKAEKKKKKKAKKDKGAKGVAPSESWFRRGLAA